ncbi:hypothetical protein PPL_03836 [Heterostelium album PN500]|uniref:Single domain-containing protein n=1 Tax=Heterostelium pallidum (strain ATCC 26659 / Pp 5 / PN500) TaxID=670386 RepID=D3B6S9_HETP5|nr:hypothetical protein PPL_03836 [Heterostelium album PN500]EFA83049.1 hypothetical protein PPL_03836 [Heterostelium album PN500]|eukprot:XP_020435166.1 hypothetical protein PPL_03836 [Heterostelium album PN500]
MKNIYTFIVFLLLLSIALSKNGCIKEEKNKDGSVSALSCPEFQIPPNSKCKRKEGDPKKPYPHCCPYPDCPKCWN